MTRIVHDLWEALSWGDQSSGHSISGKISVSNLLSVIGILGSPLRHTLLDLLFRCFDPLPSGLNTLTMLQFSLVSFPFYLPTYFVCPVLFHWLFQSLHTSLDMAVDVIRYRTFASLHLRGEERAMASLSLLR